MVVRVAITLKTVYRNMRLEVNAADIGGILLRRSAFKGMSETTPRSVVANDRNREYVEPSVVGVGSRNAGRALTS